MMEQIGLQQIIPLLLQKVLVVVVVELSQLHGGDGLSNSITGSAVVYAGGGGGSGTLGTGGDGGGTAGVNNPNSSASSPANTGGGSGGVKVL